MKTINPDAPFDKVIQPPASANVSAFNIMTRLAVGWLSSAKDVKLWVGCLC